jgi:large subunit ribosomal protein L25
METTTLKATRRTDNGKGPARRLRASGKIPSVAYGRGMTTEPLAIVREDLRSILRSERGFNSIIKLEVEDGNSYHVMVKEVTVHPLSRQLLHADFIQVAADQLIFVEVPFRTVGRSKGEQEGGTLLSNVRTLPMRCLPSQIPAVIEYDVSHLMIDDDVKVSELTLPEGLEVLLPPERRVVSVKPPRVIEAEEAAAAGAEGAPAEGAEGAAPAEGEDKKEKKEG